MLPAFSYSDMRFKESFVTALIVDGSRITFHKDNVILVKNTKITDVKVEEKLNSMIYKAKKLNNKLYKKDIAYIITYKQIIK